MIRAKFVCTSVARNDRRQELVVLEAGYHFAGYSWDSPTPTGSLTLTIDNPEAQGKFQPGCRYFIDFHTEPAEDV